LSIIRLVILLAFQQDREINIDLNLNWTTNLRNELNW